MFFIFKKRKSRKQLLQEIEELKQIYKVDTLKLDTITKQIKTVSAVCISSYEEQNDKAAKECLCNELAKEIMQYVSFEKYKIADWDGETKHVATIKIVEGKEQGYEG